MKEYRTWILLRFLQKNHRTLACFELCKPLRWRQDDTIEPFIDELFTG